jgi:hypothetical protein
MATDQDRTGIWAVEAGKRRIPANSRFYGKALEAEEMTAECRGWSGHA